MPRKARNINKSGFFHIMVQGINKEYIFNQNYQKNEYIKLMQKYNEEKKVKIISYCIMDNHSHIILHCNNISEISQYMKRLNGGYGIYYNKTNKRVGFVYRNRYQSQFITDINYLKKCISYIHMNPVKANIVKNESEYKYSSYNQFTNKEKNRIIDVETIKDIFQTDNYVEEFLKINYEEIEIMDIDREEENFKIAVNEYMNNKNIKLEDIKKDRKIAKEFCSYIKLKGYKQKQLAELLNVSEGTVSKILNSKQ